MQPPGNNFSAFERRAGVAKFAARNSRLLTLKVFPGEAVLKVTFTRFCILLTALAVAGLGVTFADNARRKRVAPASEIPVEIATNGEEIVPGRILIRLKRPLPRMLQMQLQECGVVLEGVLDGNVAIVNVPQVAPTDLIADCFRELDEVDFCEPDAVVHTDFVPSDPRMSLQWHIAQIKAPQAWNVSTGFRNTIIAIIDTGVDPIHPDLGEKLVKGYNFVGNNTNTADDNGHGTHVAGIAGAATDNSIGVAGVGYRCSIMPVKVLDSTGSGTFSAVASGISFASRNGAKIINLSLGGASSSLALAAAVDAATQRGSLIIAAAGNSASQDPQYPAAYSQSVAVGASTPTDERASFSNYGSWVDIAAPGSSIFSTFPTSNVTLGSGTSYKSMSGTSMATPVVAGVAGLIYSYLGANATPATVRSLLEATADPICKTWTNAGRVDAAAALQRAAQPAAPKDGNVANIAIHLGRWKGGDVSSVRAQDTTYFETTAQGSRGARTAEVDIDIDGLTGVLSSLDVHIVARSSVYTKQWIAFYNWSRAQFETVDTSNSRTTPQDRRIYISSAPSSFVKNGVLRIRVTQEAAAAFFQGIDFASARVVAN